MPVAREAISPSFAGHETFTLRYSWLKKAVNAIVADGELFGRPDAMVSLGVGKNMVRSIRHWALAVGVLEEDPGFPNNRGRSLRVSELGELIFGEDGIDPYLENVGTVWLIHYLLASRPDGPTTWYWAFNHLSDLEFPVGRLVADLAQRAEANDWNRVAKTTLERDVNCFIRTYIPVKRSRTVAVEDTLDCPLTELGLIDSIDSDGTYAFVRGHHPSLPTNVFAFALLQFWKRIAPRSQSLGFYDIAYEVGSPGKVFKLSESAVVDHMREIAKVTRRRVRFSSTAGLVQVYREKEICPFDVLRSLQGGRRR
ncbi:MAG: DUF4007 family protein [Planctomycetes bacterium]|nr:DUF4007 family protein [Planctomycetota bacterium]